MTSVPLPSVAFRELGEHLRQQRVAANLSVRQLSSLTGISNPYLSQIERGLRRPSAEILQQLAQGLSVSAESLYVRAGLLDPDHARYGADSRAAIRTDPRLDSAQRRALLDAYARVVGDETTSVVESNSGGPDVSRPQATTHVTKEKLMNTKSGKRAFVRATESNALTPIYAVVGASDLAVEKLRELGIKASKDAEQGLDELQHRAEYDVAKVVKGARQVPQLALNQALEAVARGRQQYDELAQRGKNVDVPAQAATTAVGLMKQATELVGRGRSQAEQVVEQAEHVVEAGLAQAEHMVEHGRTQAEHMVEQGRTQAARTVGETRRMASATRRAAATQAEHVAQQAGQVVHQASHVVDQAAHAVDAVTHAGRAPVSASVTVTADVAKPTSRRRRSPGFARTTVEAGVGVKDGVGAVATEVTRSVAGAGVAAASTVSPAKKAAAKKAAVRSAGITKPVKQAGEPATATVVGESSGAMVTPADMPATSAVPPPPAVEVIEAAAASTPSAQLPPRKES